MSSRIPAVMMLPLLAVLVLLMSAGHACAYGRSVEDLVGAFSMEKTIRLGSSSQCFSSTGGDDPLSPPRSRSADALEDDQPPGLAGFAFEPVEVFAGSQRAINLVAHVVDDQSGLWAAAAYFRGPSGRLAEIFFASQNLTSGTSRDGVYAVRMPFLQAGEKGSWRLENLTLVDREGNRRIMQSADLLQMGLPTELSVA